MVDLWLHITPSQWVCNGRAGGSLCALFFGKVVPVCNVAHHARWSYLWYTSHAYT